MRKLIRSGAIVAGVLALTNTSHAQSQYFCDSALFNAWSKFSACVGKATANLGNKSDAQLAKCRHKYFAKWGAFQLNPKLAGSACIGARFVDNGDKTVKDNLTGLIWEKKDDSGGLHDKDNMYLWSSGGPPYKPDGDVYTTFIAGLNSVGFAGAHAWRLPSLVELLTIVADFPCGGAFLSPTCTCPSNPCVDPALDSVTLLRKITGPSHNGTISTPA